MATKADEIRSLYDGQRSTKEIAALVGCDPAYVRVIARQRANGDANSASYKAYLPRRREINRDTYHLTVETFGCEDANKAGRKAYRAARKAGRNTRECITAYNVARTRVIKKLARKLK